jgi:hypothetical protein
MKFIPDSAVLGTAGHIQHLSRKKRGSEGGLDLLREGHTYHHPQRTVAELLQLAGHAQSRKKAGK